jgi:hypothetical protein
MVPKIDFESKQHLYPPHLSKKIQENTLGKSTRNNGGQVCFLHQSMYAKMFPEEKHGFIRSEYLNKRQ